MTFGRKLVCLTLMLYPSSVAAEEGKDSASRMFMELDMNKDGFLSPEEFGIPDKMDAGFDDAEIKEFEESKQEIEKSFARKDENKDGRVSQAEMDRPPTTEEDMEELDKDKDGFLVMAEFGEGLEGDFKNEFDTADKNHDGKISMEELKAFNEGEEQPPADEKADESPADEKEDKSVADETNPVQVAAAVAPADEKEDKPVADEAPEPPADEKADAPAPTAEGDMEEHDLDKDGALSLAEFSTGVEVDLKEDFDAADKDHDGKISLAELKTFHQGDGTLAAENDAPPADEKAGAPPADVYAEPAANAAKPMADPRLKNLDPEQQEELAMLRDMGHR